MIADRILFRATIRVCGWLALCALFLSLPGNAAEAVPAAHSLGPMTETEKTDTEKTETEKAEPLPALAPLDVKQEKTEYLTAEELEKKLKGLAIRKGDFVFVPYGYIFASGVYDTQATVPGEFALYSQSKAISDEPFTAVDARSSRIGLKVQGPDISALPGYKVQAVVEADFEGLVNTSRNKGGFQLRKANVELCNKDQGVRWVFGQDWEVISPLYPQMLAYVPACFAGNIGYRRCHFMREKTRQFTPNFKTTEQLSIADNFIGDFTSYTQANGKSSGLPVFEARYAVSLWEEARCGLPITVGVSGHYGEQLYDFSGFAGTRQTRPENSVPIETWSLNLDVDFPLTQQLRLQGEYYIGSNLSTFCGGINQGVDLFRREGIADKGGWISLHAIFSEKLCSNVGIAIDKPLESDLVGVTTPVNGLTCARTKNEVIFLNYMYNWSKELMFGVETSYILTEYRRADVSGDAPVFIPMASGETVRTEIAVKYSF